MLDSRQRFYIHNCPVRGEVVHLQHSTATIFAQRNYPPAIRILLGEMLVAGALLSSTLKIEGRLSIQIQGTGALKWAMAECNHHGDVRALAEFDDIDDFNQATDSGTVLSGLENGVLFINIEPESGERYQGIVSLEGDNLAQCLIQYYNLSMQIPTHLVLACEDERAGGLLIQLLPRSEEEKHHIDHDLWPRLTLLTETLKAEELTQLPAEEILYRLYNEEDIRLPAKESLQFGCTCSKERCIGALLQIGEEAVKETLTEQNPIEMHCQFCNTTYQFSAEEALSLFGTYLH